ncbi:MAG: DUF1064 domain-containing protein [Candidatus Bathyarchaeota archaeon]|jgi:hypothetical protein
MSKYRNKKQQYSFKGEMCTFDSKLEKDHAIILFSKLGSGNIKNLVLQPEFKLSSSFTMKTNANKSGSTKQRPITYVADFKYEQDGKVIVEDAKGMKTDVYGIKKKLFLSQLSDHGVDEFREVYKGYSLTYTGME